MARPYSRPEPMNTRRALALALSAVEAAASDAPDVETWRQAGEVIRGMLRQVRGEAGARVIESDFAK